MMRFGTFNSTILGFLLLTSVVAIYVVISPGAGDNWIINPLTGITAIAFSFLAFARLSVGAPNATARRIWQGVIAVFATVAASQFLEGYREALSEAFGIDDIANCVLLIVSPVTMWMIGKFDPPPLFARGLFLIGFVIQSVSTVLDVSNAILITHWSYDTAFIDLITDFGQFISLQIYIVAVAIFLVSLHLHQTMTAKGVRTVGQLSRYLFVRLQLFDKLRYPKMRIRLPGVELALWIVHLITWVPVVGPEVRAAHGKSVSRQLLEIFKLGLGAGMDARAYYLFDIYRQGGLESSGSYLTLFEAQNGLFEAIDDLVAQPLQDARNPIDDRMAFSALCEAHGLPCISPLILNEQGALVPIFASMQMRSRDVILTSEDAGDREVVQTYRHIGANRYLDETGETLSSADISARRLTVSSKSTFLILPRLVSHPDIADICRDSAAIIQVVTCLTVRRKPIVTHAMLQLGDGPDNSWGIPPAMAAPVQLSSGQIGAPIFLNRRRQAEIASSLRQQLRERILPCWGEIKHLALDAHNLFLDGFALAWDIACTPDGPVILQAHKFRDVECLQQVHRAPISNSPLGPHLFEYLQLLESRAQ